MNPIEPQKLIIRWSTNDRQAIAAIRKFFGWEDYTTLNGYSPVSLKLSDTPMFNECKRRGFFGLINGKWCKNGGRYIFIFS